MKPVTIFTGQVNGKTFKNRKEMEQYISTCIANSQPITSISYKNETKFVDENAGVQDRGGVEVGSEGHLGVRLRGKNG